MVAPESRAQTITSVPVSENGVCGDWIGLGPFRSQRMDGQKYFKAYQASERGGEIDIEILGHNRILLSGYAVQTAKGTLQV